MYTLVVTAGTGLGILELPDSESLASLGLSVIPREEGAGSHTAVFVSKGLSAGETVPKEHSDGGAQSILGVTGECNKGPSIQLLLFSHGFLPVPEKLVGKILWSEYIDMAELFRDNMEAGRRRATQEEGSSTSCKQTRREVHNLLSRIQSFVIYVSIVASKYPNRVPNMLAYQTTLVRCGGGG